VFSPSPIALVFC